MSDAEPETSAQANPELAPMTFAAFLESKPPSQQLPVTDLYREVSEHGSRYARLRTPDLALHCDTCSGTRFFRFTSGDRDIYNAAKSLSTFLYYGCSNCQESNKIFALYVTLDRGKSVGGTCYKFGEHPSFGPPTPTRLLRLLGKDRDTFLKGRRCETQGLGIGAFGYYRRVVENQKNTVLDQIIQVAQKLGGPANAVTLLSAAKSENQFLKAISSVKDALPQSLLIGGHHNPLTLLHKALSDGLHVQSDEHCLELAQDIRLVLADLAERLSSALKDEAELNAAVARLGKVGTKQADS